MNILFVCLGNICRSPMAEYLAKDYCSKHNLTHHIESAGTSGWHDGESMHSSTSAILKQLNILHDDFKSRKLTSAMLNSADYVCVMDESNLKNIQDSFKTFKAQIIQMGKLIGQEQIDDPWYTNNFAKTKEDLSKAIEILFQHLKD